MKTLEQIRSEYTRLLDTQCFIGKDLGYGVLEHHIPVLEHISTVTNSVIMIFDLYQREHVFVSENVKELFGLDAARHNVWGNPHISMTGFIPMICLHCMKPACIFFTMSFHYPFSFRRMVNWSVNTGYATARKTIYGYLNRFLWRNCSK